MYKIEIEITEEKARRWRAFLADALKRKTGKEIHEDALLDKICEAVLSRTVAKEAKHQAEEAERAA